MAVQQQRPRGDPTWSGDSGLRDGRSPGPTLGPRLGTHLGHVVPSSQTALTGPSASSRNPRTAESRSRSAVHQADARNSVTICSMGTSKVPSRRLFCQNLTSLSAR